MDNYNDIYTENNDGGINEYFDNPCQVKFIDEGHIDYVEDNFKELITKLKEEYPDFSFELANDNINDKVQLALMTGNYNSGIAYCDEVICGCCGGIVNFSEIYYMRVYNNWINLDEEIIGDDCVGCKED